MLDYGTEKQRPIERMTIAEARAYSQAGQFGAGSMAPKVAACIHFVEFGGEAAIITSLASAAQALRGKAGTQIIRS